MTNILKYNHSILILHELLYKNGSIEFVSELIRKIIKVDKELNSLELKERVKEYLFFLIKNEFIYLKYGGILFEIKNLKEFFKILDENWDKFENKNNADYEAVWYSYLIEYTEKWVNSLNEIRQKPLGI